MDLVCPQVGDDPPRVLLHRGEAVLHVAPDDGPQRHPVPDPSQVLLHHLLRHNVHHFLKTETGSIIWPWPCWPVVCAPVTDDDLRVVAAGDVRGLAEHADDSVSPRQERLEQRVLLDPVAARVPGVEHQDVAGAGAGDTGEAQCCHLYSQYSNTPTWSEDCHQSPMKDPRQK